MACAWQGLAQTGGPELLPPLELEPLVVELLLLVVVLVAELLLGAELDRVLELDPELDADPELDPELAPEVELDPELLPVPELLPERELVAPELLPDPPDPPADTQTPSLHNSPLGQVPVSAQEMAWHLPSMQAWSARQPPAQAALPPLLDPLLPPSSSSPPSAPLDPPAGVCWLHAASASAESTTASGAQRPMAGVYPSH